MRENLLARSREHAIDLSDKKIYEIEIIFSLSMKR